LISKIIVRAARCLAREGKYLPWYDFGKKADVAEHPRVFDHVGLLVNEPSSDAGVPFI
jgi:hypothetical protein